MWLALQCHLRQLCWPRHCARGRYFRHKIPLEKFVINAANRTSLRVIVCDTPRDPPRKRLRYHKRGSIRNARTPKRRPGFVLHSETAGPLKVFMWRRTAQVRLLCNKWCKQSYDMCEAVNSDMDRNVSNTAGSSQRYPNKSDAFRIVSIWLLLTSGAIDWKCTHQHQIGGCSNGDKNGHLINTGIRTWSPWHVASYVTA